MLLAIDPGKVSGAALFVDGDLVRSWTVRHAMERVSVLDQVTEHGVPVVVMERFAGCSANMLQTVQGIGERAGEWLQAVEVAVPHARVQRVYAQVWRKHLRVRCKGRDEWKEAAVKYAQERFGVTGIGADEAEAVCIGAWALEDRAVRTEMRRARRL